MLLASEAKLRADAAESRGDHAAFARHRADQRRHSAVLQRALAVLPAARAKPARGTMDDKQKTIVTIRQTLAELLHQPDPGEDLEARSDAYLVARRDSLLELRARVGAQRADALQRGDAASVLRLDAVPTDNELCSARARVFNSGVPEAEREGVARRLATCAAWQRCREAVLAEAVQTRMDSLGAELVPSDTERARARHELSARQPPPGSAQRTDAFAAAAHESVVESRAKALAAQRIAEEHRARLLATLPAPPPMPRLPPMPLSNAHAEPEPRPANGARRAK